MPMCRFKATLSILVLGTICAPAQIVTRKSTSSTSSSTDLSDSAELVRGAAALTTNQSQVRVSSTDGTLEEGSPYFTQTGTGAVARTLDAKLKERSISVLDFIPVAEHAAIQGFTSTTDVASYIASALTEACTIGKAELVFPPGLYHIHSSITIPCDGISLLGVPMPMFSANRQPTIQAGAAITMLVNDYAGGATDDIGIRGFKFDGANTATVGIMLDTARFASVEANSFINFGASAIAVKGGGLLYTNFLDNTFVSSVAGYAIDLQDSYSSNAASTYYGVNVSEVARNIFSNAKGARIGGSATISNNDFEFALASGSNAALDLCEPSASGYYHVEGNYFELTKGTVTALVGIRLCSDQEATIFGNVLFGDGTTSSVGINLAANYVYRVNVFGNTINNWVTGVIYSVVSGGGSQNGSGVIQANTFPSVTTPINPIVTYSGQAVAPDYAGVSLVSDTTGFVFSRRAIVGTAIALAAGTTSVDLALGNQYVTLNTSATTVNAVSHNKAGQFFTMYFTDSYTTLATSTFRLCGGANYTFTAGNIAGFVVDGDDYVRQSFGPNCGSHWNSYTFTKTANTVNGCNNAKGCWQLNGASGAGTTPAANVTQTLTLLALPANGWVEDVRLKTAVACANSSGTATITSIGLTGTADYYATGLAYNVETAVSDTNILLPALAGRGSNTAATTNVTITLTGDTGNIEDWDDGCSITTHLKWSVLP